MVETNGRHGQAPRINAQKLKKLGEEVVFHSITPAKLQELHPDTYQRMERWQQDSGKPLVRNASEVLLMPLTPGAPVEEQQATIKQVYAALGAKEPSEKTMQTAMERGHLIIFEQDLVRSVRTFAPNKISQHGVGRF